MLHKEEKIIWLLILGLSKISSKRTLLITKLLAAIIKIIFKSLRCFTLCFYKEAISFQLLNFVGEYLFTFYFMREI